ncbi:MAG: hypothetical protein ABI372_01520 [Ginsengibacter sp.]
MRIKRLVKAGWMEEDLIRFQAKLFRNRWLSGISKATLSYSLIAK